MGVAGGVGAAVGHGAGRRRTGPGGTPGRGRCTITLARPAPHPRRPAARSPHGRTGRAPLHHGATGVASAPWRSRPHAGAFPETVHARHPSRPRLPRGPAPPGAQDTTGTVAGTVRGPGGTLVVGAEVVLTPQRGPGGGAVVARRVFTDDEGRFRVTGMPNGKATVAVRRIGYRPATRDLDVPATEGLALALDAVPQALSTVVVKDRRVRYTGWAAPFYQRRDRGMGRYVGKEEIDRRNAMRTTDVLRVVPGMAIQTGMGGSRIRFRGSRCDPLVWIDGTPALSGYFDVDNLQPNSLEGIEVYSGVATVPVELRGPRGEEACGVIALWTRVPEPRRKGPKKVYTAEDLAALVASATVFTADQVDQAAAADSTNPIAPYYPDALRRARTAGDAVVEFVVDTAGVPELGTVGIVAASHPAFGVAARDAVSSARFSPAVKDGKPVRQLVQVPLKFELTNPGS
ncbi:TonB family protein [Roseisolibacter sp. H3M3-2]|uniref:TonB family protein n=1 Tax=Roseisolibacter sp. H3M3-2 TaxID=3031323 RepID=UPI0023DB253D|nr:TonB family protein [Roseisolibacter sp. H3M3-2]MDF1501546.1 TonB family protein [Roseisolibacter sp. H3M3-2]